MARTLEPTFSSTVKVTPTHSPPAGAVKDTEPFIKLTKPSASSFLELTSLLLSISRPVKLRRTDQDRPLQSALVQTSLLQSISPPVSSSPANLTTTDQSLQI